MPTRYQGSDEEVRALNAMIPLLRASDALVSALHRELGERGLTISQLGILEALLHVGPLCQGELASKLLRSCASMTSVVDGLEQRGLVVRQRMAEDKRFVRVALTGKGRKMIEDIFPEHAKSIAAKLSALTDREQDELRRLCRKLGTSIREG